MTVSEAISEATNNQNQNVNYINQNLLDFDEAFNEENPAQNEINSTSSNTGKLTKDQQIKSTGKKKTKTTEKKRKQTDIRGELIFLASTSG